MNDSDKTATGTTEIARAVGKGIDAIRDLGGFVARIIDGPLEQASGIVEDKLRYVRIERAIRLRDRFWQILKERGLTNPTRAIPVKLVIPLLEAASLEEDDALQDLWANLLSNAADADSGVEARRIFVDILSSLTWLDASILERIYSVPLTQENEAIWTTHLPDRIVFERPDGDNLRPPKNVEMAIANLIRQGCLSPATAWGGTQITSVVYRTVMGELFHRACAGRAH